MSERPITQVGGDGIIRPCCGDPKNLTREHTVPQRPDLVVQLCRKCHRRHFRMIAEPGVIGVKLT